MLQMNRNTKFLALGGLFAAAVLFTAPMAAQADTTTPDNKIQNLKQETDNDIKGVKVEAERKIRDLKDDAREKAADIRQDASESYDNARQGARQTYDNAKQDVNDRYHLVKDDIDNRYGADTAPLTDQSVATRVDAALAPYTSVDVSAKSGVVTLTGTVPSQKDKDIVIDKARSVRGVQSIKDELSVKNASSQGVGGYIDDAAVTTVVKSKFLGQQGLDSLDISVGTVNGVVTLSGEVDNNAQIGLAESVAKEADGAKTIVNKLTVKK